MNTVNRRQSAIVLATPEVKECAQGMGFPYFLTTLVVRINLIFFRKSEGSWERLSLGPVMGRLLKPHLVPTLNI
jgi:hypothetical protein